MRFHPQDKNYSPAVAKSRAWQNYHVSVAELGPDHPKTLACWGRVLFHDKMVPQLDSVNVLSVAWHRESGTILGYRNRSERKHEVSL